MISNKRLYDWFKRQIEEDLFWGGYCLKRNSKNIGFRDELGILVI